MLAPFFPRRINGDIGGQRVIRLGIRQRHVGLVCGDHKLVIRVVKLLIIRRVGVLRGGPRVERRDPGVVIGSLSLAVCLQIGIRLRDVRLVHILVVLGQHRIHRLIVLILGGGVTISLLPRRPVVVA